MRVFSLSREWFSAISEWFSAISEWFSAIISIYFYSCVNNFLLSLSEQKFPSFGFRSPQKTLTSEMRKRKTLTSEMRKMREMSQMRVFTLGFREVSRNSM